MDEREVDYGRELYPFLYGQEPTDDAPGAADLGALLEEVRRSTRAKAEEVVELRARILQDHRADLSMAARAMALRFAAGGTLFAFGNGGSATDASDAVADCLEPPLPGWRTLSALSLTEDGATVTAIANDVGFANVFLRQIIAYGRPGDIALGFSTSGNSENVLAGLRQAAERDMLTIGFAGYDGGEMGRAEWLDHCVVARSDHIPRIQEGHATAWHALVSGVHEALGGLA